MVISDTEYLLIYLLTICISSVFEISYCFYWVICLYLLICRNSVMTKVMSPIQGVEAQVGGRVFHLPLVNGG